MVVAASAVSAVRQAFGTLFAADDTSAFNCRPATGSTRFSQHAYVHPDGPTVHQQGQLSPDG